MSQIRSHGLEQELLAERQERAVAADRDVRAQVDHRLDEERERRAARLRRRAEKEARR